MSARASSPWLILVTDPAYDDGAILSVVDAVAGTLPPGRFLVQLRDKARERRSLAAFAARLRDATLRGGSRLVINGDVEVARDAGADGVHLGRGSLPVARARCLLAADAWISVAAHADEDVAHAVRDGADAVLVSPIFATPGKGPPRGGAALVSSRAIAGDALQVIALGGVDARSARLCRDAGADGIAVIRALLSAEDSAAEARAVALVFDRPDG